ncbi:ArsR/SmtB family transcription factor [Thermospira aquatica]|uniref:ArsR family transcriptional regulator n=1 Tax=Thermospira aquatica TaxID=2828656 RepID=A0AAX3BFM5_9SPIR|nr:metalloregulator ArsR/SmtB family transcription factor [Thermospira aquatica]URA11217.1 ArsR family transcriptional regulator [Thermospira aquatica]
MKQALDRQWLRILADETRLRIVKILTLHEWSVNDLVHILRVGQSRISRHLGILNEANLVKVRRQGLWAYYRLGEVWQDNTWLKLTLEMLSDPVYEEDAMSARLWEEQKKTATQQFFDDVAFRWQRLRLELLGEMDPLDMVLQDMGHFQRCADLGCGAGDSLSTLLHYADWVIGIDNSTQMMALARQRFIEEPRVEFRYGDIEDLPLRDGEIDLATANLTLHHLPTLQRWAQEMARVLKPHGHLVVVDFLPHEEKMLKEVYHDHWLGIDPLELTNLLKAQGFSEVKYQTLPLKKHTLEVFMLWMKNGENHGNLT